MSRKTWLIMGLALAALGFAVLQVAHSRREAQRATASPAQRGLMLMEDLGCQSCHQKDSGFRAPLLKGLYGRKVRLADGSEISADDSYIRESLQAPAKKIVAGYQALMPSYQEQLSELDIEDIIAALKP